MAQRVTILKTDDIDPKIVDGVQTFTFSVNGVDLEIDLGEVYGERFKKEMQFWQGHARRTGGRARPATSDHKSKGVDTKDVRAWAKQNNIALADRGRIPGDILERYAKRHDINLAPTPAPEPAPKPEPPAEKAKPAPRKRAAKKAASPVQPTTDPFTPDK